MTYKSLREFIEELKKSNELIVIKEPVSTYLEITEIHKRILKERGPALLFENVMINSQPSQFPMLVNLFGTKDRIAKGLQTTADKLIELGETLAFLRQPEPPRNLRDAWSMAPLVKTLLSMKPKKIKKAPCQEIVWTEDDIDLSKLPIQFCWPGDASPLITWPLVVTKGPSSDKVDDYNLGIYRMQYLSPKQTLVRWLKTRGGAAHYSKWTKDKNTDLPMAVVIGADPATILAAVTPVPETLSEYQFSGLLRKKSLELVKCKTIDLEVPAHAEIILEGYVSLKDYKNEGPFGDHTGYYNEVEKFPVFNITAITMRKDAIYLSTYTGKPDDEPSILGEALNEIFIPLLKQQFPEIIDFYLPPEGCSYRIAVVSINKTYPGQAKRIMFGIWSFIRQFILTKFIYVVDADIDCRNWKEVMWAVSTRMDPARDITIINDAPIDYLDFASAEASLGGKVGFDATNKIYPETKRNWGQEITMDQEIIDLVDNKWENYGFKKN